MGGGAEDLLIKTILGGGGAVSTILLALVVVSRYAQSFREGEKGAIDQLIEGQRRRIATLEAEVSRERELRASESGRVMGDMMALRTENSALRDDNTTLRDQLASARHELNRSLAQGR